MNISLKNTLFNDCTRANMPPEEGVIPQSASMRPHWFASQAGFAHRHISSFIEHLALKMVLDANSLT